MATPDKPCQPIRPGWQPREEATLLCDQVQAIDAWNAARRSAEATAVAAARNSREQRLSSARRLDALRRQQRALLDRTEQHMRDSAHPLQVHMAPRAVLAHRSAWFRSELTRELRAGGVCVVAALENGADAIGSTIAEQPDLLLVEDRLLMVSGADVIRSVSPFARGTIAAAQAGAEWELGALLDAGACAVFSRRLPPAEVAQDLCLLVAT